MENWITAPKAQTIIFNSQFSIFNLITMSLREIAAHKFRSFLSMLGIVLGVSSLIATLALSAGIERGVRSYLMQTGGLEMVGIADKEPSQQNADLANLSPGRTISDAHALKENVPNISHISPELIHPIVLTVDDTAERYWAKGVWPDFYTIHNYEMAAGRFITDMDVERASHVAVIGALTAKIHFPNLKPEEILGRTITLSCMSSSQMTIVGVLSLSETEIRRKRRERAELARAKQGLPPEVDVQKIDHWEFLNAKNVAVLIPISTMFQDFKSGQWQHADDYVDSARVQKIAFRVADLGQFHETLEQARTALLNTTRHGVDDFDFDTREEFFVNMERNIASTRLSGGLLALIALAVGGVGIANVMLASVASRIREIGIRMAVGARARDIFSQVLAESIVISLIGGIIGIASGMIFLKILTWVVPQDNTPVLEFSSFIISVGFAVVAGVLSGLYPALKASRLDPIEALRYE